MQQPGPSCLTPGHLGGLLGPSPQCAPSSSSLPTPTPESLCHLLLPTCSLAASMKGKKISNLPTGINTLVWFQTPPHPKASLQTARACTPSPSTQLLC